MIEAMVSVLVLSVGVICTLMTFMTTQKMSVVTERVSTLTHVAQRQIEYVEGMKYADIALSAVPTYSGNPQNPDYWVVSGSPPSYGYQHTSGGAVEPLVIDTTDPGTELVSAAQSWSEGNVSGTIYTYITWTNDPSCSKAVSGQAAAVCPPGSGTGNYKRITVAVTDDLSDTPQPTYVSSVVADPNAPNPLDDASTQCQSSPGVVVACEAGINSGEPNTYYLHDCAGTNASCSTPTAPHALHDTAGPSGACPGPGCPVPDLMDENTPTSEADGSAPALQDYSTDLDNGGLSGVSGGRLLRPLCGDTSGCGTGNGSDCTEANATGSTTLDNAQNELWVSPPLSGALTLTGNGGMNLYSQTQSGTPAVVTLCLAVYDVPPSGGVSGSLSDILAAGSQPVLLGFVAYVPPTDPATGSNWPTSASNFAFSFDFLAPGTTAKVDTGHRIGVRLWDAVSSNTNIALIYDNPSDPSEIQLNSQ